MSVSKVDFDIDREKWRNSLHYCREKDVLVAFLAVAEEILAKCHRFAGCAVTPREACQLAGRVREQRELLRPIARDIPRRKLRCLLHVNRRFREKVAAVAEKAHVNAKIIAFK